MTARKRQTSPLIYILILIALVYYLTPFILNFTTPETVKWGQGHFLTVLSEWDMRVHDKGRIVITGMDGRRTVFNTNSDTNITLEGLFPDENENSAATD